MKIVTRFPYKVRIIEHTWIPMKDGRRLSARLWIPENANTEPVPAILEYIPYRKRDKKRARDEQMHGWFAGHGYACVRVDIRGSGDPEGILKMNIYRANLTTACKYYNGSPIRTGAMEMSALSVFHGAALTACKSLRCNRHSLKPLSVSLPPMTATPMIFTIWAAAFWVTIYHGPR